MIKETLINMPLEQAIELEKGRRIKIKKTLTRFTQNTIKVQNGIYLQCNIKDELLTNSNSVLNRNIIVQITNKQIIKYFNITYILLYANIVDIR